MTKTFIYGAVAVIVVFVLILGVLMLQNPTALKTTLSRPPSDTCLNQYALAMLTLLGTGTYETAPRTLYINDEDYTERVVDYKTAYAAGLAVTRTPSINSEEEILRAFSNAFIESLDPGSNRNIRSDDTTEANESLFALYFGLIDQTDTKLRACRTKTPSLPGGTLPR